MRRRISRKNPEVRLAVDVFDNMKTNFAINRTDDANGNYVVKSPIETVVVEKTDTGYVIGRTLFNSYHTKTETSKKYEIFSTSEIVKAFYDSEYYNDVRKKISEVVFDNVGGFFLNTEKVHSDRKVLVRSNKTYTKEVFGEYTKSINVVNSYDRSRAISVQIGLNRNGFIKSGYDSQSFKHLVYNKEKMEESVVELINSIPELVNTKDVFEDMYNTVLTDKIKADFLKDLNEYIEGKLNSKTVLKTRKYVPILNFIKDEFNKFIPLCDNFLDFQSVLSQLKNFAEGSMVFTSFEKGILVVLENKMINLF